MTPSKIPVGSFRVEEEKRITRALTGEAELSEAGLKVEVRAGRERSSSRLPVPRCRPGPAVTRLGRKARSQSRSDATR